MIINQRNNLNCRFLQKVCKSVFISYPLQANVFHVFTLWGMFLGIAPLLTNAIVLSAMMAMNNNATTNFGLVIEKTLSD